MDKTNDDNGLSEQPFRMGRGDFARKMFHFWGITPLLLLCALALVGIFAGFLIDIRYSILALMVVFILMPTVMMFLYYYHGLSENCRFNIVDHNLYVGRLFPQSYGGESRCPEAGGSLYRLRPDNEFQSV